MKEIRGAAHDCEVAIGRISECATSPELARASERALHALALDIHHECRRLREFSRAEAAGRQHALGSIISWLAQPVGAGGRGVGTARRLRAMHRTASLTSLAAALATALLVAIGQASAAIVVLLVGGGASTLMYYTQSSEGAVTFRARYFSCLMDHLGDLLILVGASWFLWRQASATVVALPILVATVVLFGTVIRTGALQVGVYAPRQRVERVVRLLSLVVGIGGVAAGAAELFAVTLLLTLFHLGTETIKVFRLVWRAGATEFAWTTLTADGYKGDMLIAAPTCLGPARGELCDDGLSLV